MKKEDQILLAGGSGEQPQFLGTGYDKHVR
jgi:hypothetical protein